MVQHKDMNAKLSTWTRALLIGSVLGGVSLTVALNTAGAKASPQNANVVYGESLGLLGGGGGSAYGDGGTQPPSYAAYDGSTQPPRYADHDGGTQPPGYAAYDGSTQPPDYAAYDGSTSPPVQATADGGTYKSIAQTDGGREDPSAKADSGKDEPIALATACERTDAGTSCSPGSDGGRGQAERQVLASR